MPPALEGWARDARVEWDLSAVMGTIRPAARPSGDRDRTMHPEAPMSTVDHGPGTLPAPAELGGLVVLDLKGEGALNWMTDVGLYTGQKDRRQLGVVRSS